jgi:hypothetical protein
MVNGKKEHLLHNNFGEKDVFFQYTNVRLNAVPLNQELRRLE